jgi:hypothetical protein
VFERLQEVQKLIGSPRARVIAGDKAIKESATGVMAGRELTGTDTLPGGTGGQDAMQTASRLLNGVPSERFEAVEEAEVGGKEEAGLGPELTDSLVGSSGMGDTVLKPPPGEAIQAAGPFAAQRTAGPGMDSGRFVRLEGAGGSGFSGPTASGGGLEGLMQGIGSGGGSVAGDRHHFTMPSRHGTPERQANIPPMSQTTPPSNGDEPNPLVNTSDMLPMADPSLGGSNTSLQLATGRSRSVHTLQQPTSPATAANAPLPNASDPESPPAVPPSAGVSHSFSTSPRPRTGAACMSTFRPPPINVPRTSLHAIPAASVASAPHSPTSSIGGFSSVSHSGARTSLHAMPRAARSGAFGSGALANPALAARIAADQRMARGALTSPASGSIVSATSSARRRARASLHVLPRAAAPI